MDSENSETLPIASSFPLSTGRQRRGKVARLPKATRDRINNMLLDGLSYADILEKLGADANGVTEVNLGNWKTGGYQDWLRDQQRVEALKYRQDFAFDLVCDKDGNQLHQTTLQLAATNLVQLLVDLDPVALRDTLETDPDKYTRLLNALARISDGEMRCERHRTQEAERKAELARAKSSPAKGGISDEALRQAEERLKLL